MTRMWIVRLALRGPDTFVVVAVLIVVRAFVRCPHAHRHLPRRGYPGGQRGVVVHRHLPGDIERRVLRPTERALTGSVNDIEHMESQAMVGVGPRRSRPSTTRDREALTPPTDEHPGPSNEYAGLEVQLSDLQSGTADAAASASGCNRQ